MSLSVKTLDEILNIVKTSIPYYGDVLRLLESYIINDVPTDIFGDDVYPNEIMNIKTILTPIIEYLMDVSDMEYDKKSLYNLKYCEHMKESFVKEVKKELLNCNEHSVECILKILQISFKYYVGKIDMYYCNSLCTESHTKPSRYCRNATTYKTHQIGAAYDIFYNVYMGAGAIHKYLNDMCTNDYDMKIASNWPNWYIAPIYNYPWVTIRRSYMEILAKKDICKDDSDSDDELLSLDSDCEEVDSDGEILYDPKDGNFNENKANTKTIPNTDTCKIPDNSYVMDLCIVHKVNGNITTFKTNVQYNGDVIKLPNKSILIDGCIYVTNNTTSQQMITYEPLQ